MKYDPRPTPGDPPVEAGKRVRVMIEPADSDAEARVMSQLNKVGATRVNQIAKGFVSAEVSVADIPHLRNIARTGILPEKQLRKT